MIIDNISRYAPTLIKGADAVANEKTADNSHNNSHADGRYLKAGARLHKANETDLADTQVVTNTDKTTNKQIAKETLTNYGKKADAGLTGLSKEEYENILKLAGFKPNDKNIPSQQEVLLIIREQEEQKHNTQNKDANSKKARAIALSVKDDSEKTYVKQSISKFKPLTEAKRGLYDFSRIVNIKPENLYDKKSEFSGVQEFTKTHTGGCDCMTCLSRGLIRGLFSKIGNGGVLDSMTAKFFRNPEIAVIEMKSEASQEILKFKPEEIQLILKDIVVKSDICPECGTLWVRGINTNIITREVNPPSVDYVNKFTPPTSVEIPPSTEDLVPVEFRI